MHMQARTLPSHSSFKAADKQPNAEGIDSTLAAVG